jgi:hypothetical protein
LDEGDRVVGVADIAGREEEDDEAEPEAAAEVVEQDPVDED